MSGPLILDYDTPRARDLRPVFRRFGRVLLVICAGAMLGAGLGFAVSPARVYSDVGLLRISAPKGSFRLRPEVAARRNIDYMAERQSVLSTLHHPDFAGSVLGARDPSLGALTLTPEALRSRLMIDDIARTELIRVTVSGTDPDECRDLARAAVTVACDKAQAIGLTRVEVINNSGGTSLSVRDLRRTFAVGGASIGCVIALLWALLRERSRSMSATNDPLAPAAASPPYRSAT